jgi:hypothetical protein
MDKKQNSHLPKLYIKIDEGIQNTLNTLSDRFLFGEDGGKKYVKRRIL